MISDDHALAFSLRVLLKRDGHSVMVAEDASAGLFRLFIDQPGFVVVSLRLENEVRKVCRHLHENAKVPFLIIGNPSLLNDPELKGLLPPDSFLSLPASVRRIWSRITEILRQHLGTAAGSHGVSEPGGGLRIRTCGTSDLGRRNRSADRRCRTYERHSRINPVCARRPSLEIWV